MAISQGTPCWYELGTNDLDAAGAFYTTVLGWHVHDPGMDGHDYRVAQIDGSMVAGMMSTADQQGPPPPNWLIYFTVDDADRAAADITAAGGQTIVAPTDIPGTGRFSILADPQGAAFGVLQPTPMEGEEATNRAFDQQRRGHGNWHELMTPDPAAAFEWYSQRFGWTKGEAMDMGEMGTYQLFADDGSDIGGMMNQGESPVPCWLPYFGVEAVGASMDTITSAGGIVMHGPMEVPGGSFVAVAADPQGAVFAIVGQE